MGGGGWVGDHPRRSRGRKDGSENYKVYEVSTIIDTPEEYLLILKEPKGGEPIERVQKDIFHLIVE